MLSLVFAALLLGPFSLLISQKVFDVQLPIWMTSEEAQYMTGDFVGKGSSVEGAISYLTFEGVKNRNLQNALEEVIDLNIPLKGIAMSGNAGIQRGFIGLSNDVFGWECYPAKYGSEFVVWPEGNAILSVALKEAESNNEATRQFIDAVNRAASNHPDVRFVFQELVDTYVTEHNPSHALVSKPYDRQWIYENVEARLSPNVEYVVEDIVSKDELASEWFSTEHHWKPERALRAYDELAERLELSLVEEDFSEEIIDSWNGSSSRGGLYFETCDSLWDTPKRFDNLTVSYHGQTIERGAKDSWPKLAGELDAAAFKYNAYHMYFGGSRDEIVYENSGPNNGKTCLFIEQSYGVPVERYIADNYRQTVAIAPLNCSVEDGIEEYIRNYDIDDVVIQLGPANLHYLFQNSPKFLER